jgi:hypothetical protein
MSILWPKAQQLLVVPKGHQAQIIDVSHTHNLALSLLSVLSFSPPNGALALGTPSMVMVSKWALDIGRRVLKTCKSFFATTPADSDRILSGVLRTAFSAHSMKDSSSQTGLLLDLLVEILWGFQHHGGNELYNALDEKIHDFLREDQNPQVLKACRRRFLPLLKVWRKNDMGDNQKDFQVSAPFMSQTVLVDERFAAIAERNTRLLLQE